MRLRYTFRCSGSTVTVTATNPNEAVMKARNVMDQRYEKRNMEPPVSWSLELLKAIPVVVKKYGTRSRTS